MKGIACRKERKSLGPPAGPPVGDLWRFNCDHVEFVLRGSAAYPDPTWLEMAETAATEQTAFIEEAQKYLQAFVAAEKFGATGDWEPFSFEFGGSLDEPGNSFELLLGLPGDQYGLWGVRFRYDPALRTFWPYQFRRRQW